jgi:hypothetical protein
MLPIFMTPEFWISLVSLLVLILAQYVPGFTLDVPILVGYILVVVAMLYKVASDPDTNPIGKWVRAFKTPEFVAALLSIALMILQGFGVVVNFGITIEQIAGAVVILVGYIFGTAYQTRQLRIMKMRNPPPMLKLKV